MNTTPHDRVADEEVVIYHIAKRERTPVRDRLTPRMEARRLIDALDAGRAMRHPEDCDDRLRGILATVIEELDGWRDAGSDVMRNERVDDFIEAARAALNA